MTIHTLNYLENKAIELLKRFEPKNGYVLGFSGGKDSVVIYHLAKKSGVKFTAEYSLTSVDPPDLIRFIRKEYPDVKFNKPQYTMWQLIVKYGYPPTRRWRYCCKYLKEKTNDGMVIVGTRAEESMRRAKQQMIDMMSKTKILIKPIFEWTEQNVWDYIKQENITYCKLYDEGWTRIGCIGCPTARIQERLRVFECYPKYYYNYIKTFDRMLQKRKEKGKPSKQWNTGQDVMDWWLYGKRPNFNKKEQQTLFEGDKND